MAYPLPPYDPYYPAPPPPLPDYGYAHSDRNGINTLFVSGLPDDVKAREIHNLFRRRIGFESCQLKYTGRGNQVVAFATFADPDSAMSALLSLNGVKFDPQTGSTLHIELARSNSRRKHKPGIGPYVVIDRRMKPGADVNADAGVDGDARESSSNDGDSDSDDLATNHDSGDQDDSAAEKSNESPAVGNEAEAPEHEQAKNTTDGACSTLFIANLGPTCSDEELKQALSQYPGFTSTKVRARGGMPVAFADFEKVEQATGAMNALQGSSLPSSDRGGMHIEYARSKMRKP